VRGTAGGGGALSRHRLLEGEMMGHHPFKGEMKRRRRRIFSFFHLALEGDKQRHEERRRAGERWRWLGGLEVEEDSVGPAGPNCLATWADSREKWHGPQDGMGQNSRDKDLSSKIKESNTFKLKFELRPNQHKFK
jgi:hypothetical protein